MFIRLFTRLFGFTFRLLFLALVLGLGVSALLIYGLDWQARKDLIEQQVFAATGRTLEIAGEVAFSLAFPPRVTVHDVTFENAPWGTRRDMVHVDTIVAELDPLPLLYGELAIPRLRLIGADVLLETSPQGVANWDLPGLASPQSSTNGDTSLVLLDLRNAFQGAGVSLEGGTITFRDGPSGLTQMIQLPDTGLGIGGTGSLVCP